MIEEQGLKNEEGMTQRAEKRKKVEVIFTQFLSSTYHFCDTFINN